jgi:poly(hydroxyalkanoate) depolymerase family esterase
MTRRLSQCICSAITAVNSKEISMTRSFAAAVRRVNRLMRPTRTTKSIQKMMTGLMVKSALASLPAATPKTAKSRKVATPKAGRTLGVVLRQLRAAQSLVPSPTTGTSGRVASPRIPKDAQYLDRTHRSAAGSRGYKIYLPASQPKRPKGLILMLHGCNQTPDDFALGTHMNALAEKNGLVIAYPAQTVSHNGSSCWNWFKPGNQGRGAGEPAILASLARKLAQEFDVGRDQVFVAGLSAGGAMAAILADAYPDVFSAVGVHSGLARGAARDVVSALSAMRKGAPGRLAPVAHLSPHTVRRIIFHGDTDSTVHPANASRIVAAAVGGRTTPTNVSRRTVRGRGYVRSVFAGQDGTAMLELWMLEGAGHAWSGGRASGSYTDSNGPDASAQMIRFFLANTV